MSPTTLGQFDSTRVSVRHRGRRLAALALAMLTVTTGAVITGVVTAPEALAADNGQWSVFPVQPRGRQDRVAYFLEVAAGQTYKDAVTIRNKLDRPIFLELRTADAMNAQAGGFAPRRPGEPNTGVGSWVKLPTKSVNIAAKATITIPLIMTVPRNATPGDHVGAILALDPTVRGTAAGGTQIGATYEVGARVYARVAGQLTTQMSIQDVELEVKQKAIFPFFQHGKGVIRYTIVNTGNTRINATEKVEVTGLFGRSISSFPTRGVPELLPGGSFVVELAWDGVPALDQVHIRVDLQAPGASAGGDRTDWVISWIFLLIVLGLILAFMAYRWWRNRNREEDEPTPLTSGTPFPSSVGVTSSAVGVEASPGRSRHGRRG